MVRIDNLTIAVMEVDARKGFGGPCGGEIGGGGDVFIGAGLFRGDASPLAPTTVRERHRVFMKSGVTVEVTEDILQRHFACYGNVTDVYIPRVMPTHIPKGFAYISFDSEEAVHRALELESHEIDGKHFPVGKAEPRPSERGIWHCDQDSQRRLRGYNQVHVPWSGLGTRPTGPPVHCPPPPGTPLNPPGSSVEAPADIPYISEAPQYHAEVEPFSWMPRPPSRSSYGNAVMKRKICRIFVGGVPDMLSEEDVKVHFEKYGKVEDVYFPKEKETSRRRGFCYVRFDNPKAADAAAARSSRTIGGNDIGEIKIAQPRPGDGPYLDFHQNRNGYPTGGYGHYRTGTPYNSRVFEGRSSTRFCPYQGWINS